MKLESDGHHTIVTLSEKNLRTGLHKLVMPYSARMIISGCGKLVLKFETDEEHYEGREPAGTMHPDTEDFVGCFQSCAEEGCGGCDR